jgi:hypothetical protein
MIFKSSILDFKRSPQNSTHDSFMVRVLHMLCPFRWIQCDCECSASKLSKELKIHVFVFQWFGIKANLRTMGRCTESIASQSYTMDCWSGKSAGFLLLTLMQVMAKNNRMRYHVLSNTFLLSARFWKSNALVIRIFSRLESNYQANNEVSEWQEQ